MAIHTGMSLVHKARSTYAILTWMPYGNGIIFILYYYIYIFIVGTERKIFAHIESKRAHSCYYFGVSFMCTTTITSYSGAFTLHTHYVYIDIFMYLYVAYIRLILYYLYSTNIFIIFPYIAHYFNSVFYMWSWIAFCSYGAHEHNTHIMQFVFNVIYKLLKCLWALQNAADIYIRIHKYLSDFILTGKVKVAF